MMVTTKEKNKGGDCYFKGQKVKRWIRESLFGGDI